MERLERLTVQLLEAENMLARHSVPHVRIGYMLLDNFVETVMHHTCEAELAGRRWLTPTHDHLKQLVDAGAGGKIRVHYEELAKRVVPKAREKQIARVFDSKIEFLVENSLMESRTGKALSKLHKYRNSIYHRDSIQADVIRTTALIYFNLACTVLENYHPLMYLLLTATEVPAMSAVLGDFSPLDSDNLASDLAQAFRVRAKQDDDMAEVLVGHLHRRITEVEESLELVSEFGWTRDEVIKLVQLNPAGPISSTDLARAKCRYTIDDFERWRQEADNLLPQGDSLEIFLRFSLIEDDLEELEGPALEAGRMADREIQLQIDIARGK